MIANPLLLKFIRLPLSCPPGGVLPADALHAPQVLAEQLAAARAELSELQTQADTLRAEAQRQAEETRAALLAAARAECAAIRRQAGETATADAVTWMIDEAALEAEVARQLMQRWRPLLADVLAALLAQSGSDERFLNQLQRLVLERLPHGRFRLAVSPSQHAVVAATFAHLVAVSVEVDAALACDQAVLDNGLVRVRLDWPAYQARLLQQLACDLEESKDG